jgi:hypothetical protein
VEQIAERCHASNQVLKSIAKINEENVLHILKVCISGLFEWLVSD